MNICPHPQAGNVKFVDLFQEPGGRSKGCAVVEYETAQEAHAAIRDLHDSDLKGRLIFVREDREEVHAVEYIAALKGLALKSGAKCFFNRRLFFCSAARGNQCNGGMCHRWNHRGFTADHQLNRLRRDVHYRMKVRPLFRAPKFIAAVSIAVSVTSISQSVDLL